MYFQGRIFLELRNLEATFVENFIFVGLSDSLKEKYISKFDVCNRFALRACTSKVEYFYNSMSKRVHVSKISTL